MNNIDLNSVIVPLEYDVKKAIKQLSVNGDRKLFLEVMNFARPVMKWYRQDVMVAAFLATRFSPDVEVFNKLFFTRGSERFVAWIPYDLGAETFISDLFAVHSAGSERILVKEEWILAKEKLFQWFNVESALQENINKNLGVIKPFNNKDTVYGWHIFRRDAEIPDETAAFLSLQQLDYGVKRMLLEVAKCLQLKPRS